MQVDYAYVERMQAALLRFHSDSSVYFQSQNGPAAGSQAATEYATYARPESVVSAWAIGQLLLEYGADHLTAFVKTATNPVEVIACFTCVRSMLEPCAIAAWVLDPAIDAHTRVSRVFAHRYEGLEQQLTLGRTAGNSHAEIQSLEKHVEDVEQDALALGFPKLLDKKDRRMGIGVAMPNATDMIRDVLGEEQVYRMLSAVVHGHMWAITSLCFKQVVSNASFGPAQARGFTKTNDALGFAFLGMRVLKAIARPLWYHCHYFGWDALKLEEALERVADDLQATVATRFWRPAN